MKNEFLTFTQHLIGAGITGVYQGTVLVLLAWLAFRALPRTNAATRHGVWFCTLLMLVFILVAHCLLDPPSLTPDNTPLQAALNSSSHSEPLPATASPNTTPLAEDSDPLPLTQKQPADSLLFALEDPFWT